MSIAVPKTIAGLLQPLWAYGADEWLMANGSFILEHHVQVQAKRQQDANQRNVNAEIPCGPHLHQQTQKLQSL